MNIRDTFELAVRTVREFFQDQWFDRTRNVRTSGNVSVEQIGTAAHDSHDYQPARPAHIRHVLHQLPLRDVTPYSYIDFGSGKGRTLFIAAERPFRQIIGVELSQRLHDEARANIRTFRRWKRTWAREIKSLHQNATDFEFPAGPLVLYLFNPFGRDTAERVLSNLNASLGRDPRRVIIILLWPRWEDLVGGITGAHLCATGSYYRIFDLNPAQSANEISPAEKTLQRC